MARKNPLGKLVHTAVDVLKDPKGAADKVVDQAKGTASLGKLVAGQLTRTAASTAGAVAERAGVARGPHAPERPAPASRADLRPVPEVNEPAHPVQRPAEEPPTPEDVASTTARKAPAKKADGGPVRKAPARKAPAKKAAAKKAPAKKAAAKKAPAKRAQKSATARIEEPTSGPEAVPDRRAAEPASSTQEQALSPNPEEVARKAAAKGAAANETPAERAAASQTVKQAPAKKATAKKAAGKKAAAKKTTPRKSTTKKAAEVAEDRDVSPVGEDETVWSTSTPGDKLPAGRGKRNEADPEVPVTEEDREAAREASPTEVAERTESD